MWEVQAGSKHPHSSPKQPTQVLSPQKSRSLPLGALLRDLEGQRTQKGPWIQRHEFFLEDMKKSTRCLGTCEEANAVRFGAEELSEREGRKTNNNRRSFTDLIVKLNGLARTESP